jgi:3-phenylpropionate/cinnamic acid dioxygenase small subunit
VTQSVVISDQSYRECCEFLFQEAEFLDDNQMHDWLALMHPDVEYVMPTRTTRERAAGPGFGEASWHMHEDWGALETRVARLDTEYAWAEDPPSRTRRMVSNIRVTAAVNDDELNVKSNLFLFRGRGDQTSYNLLCAERRDVLQRGDNGLKLRKRLVLLDHTTLGTHNLGVFL